MNSWSLPTEEEFNTELKNTPQRIKDLAPGRFKGQIEEIIHYEEADGSTSYDSFGLGIRVVETDNPAHQGKVLSYGIYLRTKRGKTNPHAYRFLKALIPGIAKGEAWNPNELMMAVFNAEVVYNQANYWNFENVEFLGINDDFDMD
jgi:hypothetical protein